MGRYTYRTTGESAYRRLSSWFRWHKRVNRFAGHGRVLIEFIGVVQGDVGRAIFEHPPYQYLGIVQPVKIAAESLATLARHFTAGFGPRMGSGFFDWPPFKLNC
jgi:hypothetical protein